MVAMRKRHGESSPQTHPGCQSPPELLHFLCVCVCTVCVYIYILYYILYVKYYILYIIYYILYIIYYILYIIYYILYIIYIILYIIYYMLYIIYIYQPHFFGNNRFSRRIPSTEAHPSSIGAVAKVRPNSLQKRLPSAFKIRPPTPRSAS